MQLSRRPAEPADAEFVRDAHHRAYRDVVERQFGRWDVGEQDEFFDRNWATGGFEVLLHDGAPCGYVAVERRDDDVYLGELVILPEFQNRGIGSAVLAETFDLADASGVPVRLQVLHENRRGRALYERLGFSEAGRTETHVVLERLASSTRPSGAGPVAT